MFESEVSESGIIITFALALETILDELFSIGCDPANEINNIDRNDMKQKKKRRLSPKNKKETKEERIIIGIESLKKIC